MNEGRITVTINGDEFPAARKSFDTDFEYTEHGDVLRARGILVLEVEGFGVVTEIQDALRSMQREESACD